MKKMMKIMLLSGILLGTKSVQAQETVPVRKVEKENQFSELSAEERAKKRTAKMTEELDLDENQQTQIYAIHLAHIIEMDQLKKEQEALREKMKAEREATRNEIKAVLTTDQNVKFDQMVEEHKQKKEQHRTH